MERLSCSWSSHSCDIETTATRTYVNPSHLTVMPSKRCHEHNIQRWWGINEQGDTTVVQIHEPIPMSISFPQALTIQSPTNHGCNRVSYQNLPRAPTCTAHRTRISQILPQRRFSHFRPLTSVHRDRAKSGHLARSLTTLQHRTVSTKKDPRSAYRISKHSNYHKNRPETIIVMSIASIIVIIVKYQRRSTE